MSDPVTNVEIEDILSSIRRLVSDDGRPVEEGESREEERLVLTPSLRVTGADDARDEEEATDSAVDAADEDADAAPSPRDGAHGDGPPSEVSSERPDDLQRDPGHPGDLRSRIAALEASVATREDDWDPDGPGEDAYAGGPVEALPWEDHFEDAETTDAEPADAGGPVHDDADAHETAADPAGDAADAGQVKESDGESATPGAEGDAGSDPAANAQDEAHEDEDDMAELFAGEDPVLDEAALREMITDIVRQELQGSLGERITRNVRKLVRREIHRAMASYDLD